MTNITRICASNLNLANDVYNLEDRHINLQMAGVTWLVPMHSKYDELMSLFTHVLEEIDSWEKSFQPIFIMGHSSWIPETRITNYKKYSGSFKDSFCREWSFQNVSEVKIRDNGKVKYVAGANLRKNDLADALDILLGKRMSGVIFVNDERFIDEVLADGWSGTYPVDEDMFEKVCGKGGVLLKKVGGYETASNTFCDFRNSSFLLMLSKS